MTNDSLFTRRRMLQLTGGAAVVGLAGCTGAPTNDSGANNTPADEPASDSSTEDQHDESEAETEGDGHDDGEDDHDDAVGAPADTAEVAMVNADDGFHFEPHVVRVNVGGTVTFVNESGSHSTTAYHPDNDQPQLVPDGAASWDSGILSEGGATFEHTFETEGVYHYYCIPHESLGMIGSVIVGEPDPHEQVALEEPPADKPERVREKLEELNGMIRTALDDDHE
ncbi:plastocyanin/azurin family copper-binding protein [Haloferax chudinovii]|uniref:Plastocyanin/azurin family copper-binding protein n=1 Tax=Haloferax chudinovii TaxID=1109010 RepID=A0ABD5XHF6_9EURY